MLALVLDSLVTWLSLRTKLWSFVLALALKAKFLVLALMCYYGGLEVDTIDWSYILPDDGRVIYIHANKQGCWPWSLVVLKDKIVAIGPGLGLMGLASRDYM